MSYPRIFEKVFYQPWLIMPEFHRSIQQSLLEYVKSGQNINAVPLNQNINDHGLAAFPAEERMKRFEGARDVLLTFLFMESLESI